MGWCAFTWHHPGKLPWSTSWILYHLTTAGQLLRRFHMTTDDSIGWAFAESAGVFGCQRKWKPRGTLEINKVPKRGVLMPRTGTRRISLQMDVSRDRGCQTVQLAFPPEVDQGCHCRAQWTHTNTLCNPPWEVAYTNLG